MENKQMRVRDRFWAWAHIEGAYSGKYNSTIDYNLGSIASRITPFEGAMYLGLRNLIFIRYYNNPVPPFDHYALPLGMLDRLEWSLTGADGITSNEERQQVYNLAGNMPNISGLIMDDFFNEPNSPTAASLSVDDLAAIRDEIKNIDGRRLDLSVVLYSTFINPSVIPYLELCDSISFYTWRAEDLKELERNIDNLEKLVPGKRIRLGCYMWDFGGKVGPISISNMRQQCELGLSWLKDKRIEGMIFLGTNICDLDVETVEWTRNWISEVGDETL